MPITITITGETAKDAIAEVVALAAGLSSAGAQFAVSVGMTAPTEEPKPAGNSAKKATRASSAKATTQEAGDQTSASGPSATNGASPSDDDAALAAEIAADVAQAPAEPKGATAVVDAGTGKPMEAPQTEMTIEDVRAAATRLAQADATQLKAILGEFGAAKLSEVKPDDLGDFAGKVLAALG